MIGLLDGDRGRNPIDEVGLRLVHPLEKLPRVRTERLDIPPLSFRVERIEGETRLAAPARTRDDDQLPERQIEVNTLQVILTRATDAYDRRHRASYDEKSRRRAVFLSIFQLISAQKNALPHNLARLELNRCARGNHDIVFGLVGIAPDTRLGKPHFEDAKIPQLHILSFREGFSDVIECFLNYIENVLLNKPRLLADPHY